MSQYISKSNQDLLWNTFQKIPEVQRNFQPDLQQNIFRNAISHFYQQMNPNVTLRVDQLKELNKQTVTYLIDKVRPPSYSQGQNYSRGQSHSQGQSQGQQSQGQNQKQLPQVFETTEDKTQRIFSEKQKMYDQMTSKPDLPKPSELFQEAATDDDGAILDMDARISQYQEQRNQEVPAYDPIPTTTNAANPHTLQSLYTMIEQLQSRVNTLETHFVGLDEIIETI